MWRVPSNFKNFEKGPLKGRAEFRGSRQISNFRVLPGGCGKFIAEGVGRSLLGVRGDCFWRCGKFVPEGAGNSLLGVWVIRC